MSWLGTPSTLAIAHWQCTLCRLLCRPSVLGNGTLLTKTFLVTAMIFKSKMKSVPMQALCNRGMPQHLRIAAYCSQHCMPCWEANVQTCASVYAYCPWKCMPHSGLCSANATVTATSAGACSLASSDSIGCSALAPVSPTILSGYCFLLHQPLVLKEGLLSQHWSRA